MKSLEKLNRKFASLTSSGRMNEDTFRSALKDHNGQSGKYVNELFVRRLFLIMDKNKDGYVDRNEFVDEIIQLKTVDDKLELLFRVYDEDGDGQMDYEEVKRMLAAMIQSGDLRLGGNEYTNKLTDLFIREAKVTQGGQDDQDDEDEDDDDDDNIPQVIFHFEVNKG